MLLKNSVIYLIGRIIPSAINFSLVALYTRLMGPDEYGKYASVVAAGIMGFNLGSMWLNMAALRLYAKNDDKKPLLWSLFVGFSAVIGIGIVVSAGIALWLGTVEQAVLVVLGFLLFAGTAWFELNLHLMQARLEAMSYVVQNIARTALGGLIGGLLAWAGWGAQGILIGTILGLVIPAIPMTIRQWRELEVRRRHPEAMREVLEYGIPLSMSFAVQSVVNVTDRFLVLAINGTTALGLYAVGYDLADRIIRALSQPLGAASLPLAIARLEKEGPEGAREQCKQNLVVLLLLALPACLGLIAITPDLVDIVVGAEYRESSKQIVPIIALTSIVMMLRGNYLDHAFHLGMQPRRQLVTSSIVAVTNFVFGFMLVHRYGAVGAAYGALLAYTLAFLISLFLGRKVFPLPLMPVEVLKITAAAVLMMLVARYLQVPGGELVNLLVKTASGAVVYIGLILLFDVNGMRRHLLKFGQRWQLKFSR